MRTIRTLTPSDEMRIFAGAVVQPLLAAALAFVSFPLIMLDRNGRTLAGGTTDVVQTATSAAAGVGLVALVVTIVGAIPTAVWLLKRRRVSLLETLAFGLGFGILPFAFGALTAGTYGIAGVIRGVAFSSLLGVAGAAAFWGIALRHEDDDAGNPAEHASSSRGDQ